MVGIAVVSLSRRHLQEREGRWLTLISGAVMLARFTVVPSCSVGCEHARGEGREARGAEQLDEMNSTDSTTTLTSGREGLGPSRAHRRGTPRLNDAGRQTG
jgi:hypothetical protein